MVVLSLWLLSFSVPQSSLSVSVNNQGCSPKYFGYESTVCVCTASYCDTLPPVSAKAGEFLQITSSKDGKRWHEERSSISHTHHQTTKYGYDVALNVDPEEGFQRILGFGGAFTDSTGFNLLQLPEALREKVIKSYYDSDGLEYNLGRVPIGGTDFSTHPYTYDDLPPGQTDANLNHFKIATEDFTYKIPFILKAKDLCKRRGVELNLFSSPWSAPAWMKDNRSIIGKGKLLKKYYSAWAKYFIKFFQSYQSEGIHFFATTPQNEPTSGLYEGYPFNAMGWLAEEQGDWVGNYLGPELRKAGFVNTTLLIGDDLRYLFPVWIDKVLITPKASDYVGGIAVHWYWDGITPTSLLDSTHEKYPHLPILYTEACAGYGFWDLMKVILGSWVRAEFYAEDIIENLNHWVVGWTDWNMALDLEGGPTWVKNFVDSPIIVNKAEKKIYKQPMYYALAHFSKVFPKGSQRVKVSSKGSAKASISFTGFRRPDNITAVTILNRNKSQIKVLLSVENSFEKFFTLDERSITTVAWNSQDENWIH